MTTDETGCDAGQCNVATCSAMQRYPAPCNLTLEKCGVMRIDRHARQCSAMQRNIIAMLCQTGRPPCKAMRCHAMPCYEHIQCYATLRYALYQSLLVLLLLVVFFSSVALVAAESCWPSNSQSTRTGILGDASGGGPRGPFLKVVEAATIRGSARLPYTTLDIAGSNQRRDRQTLPLRGWTSRYCASVQSLHTTRLWPVLKCSRTEMACQKKKEPGTRIRSKRASLSRW